MALEQEQGYQQVYYQMPDGQIAVLNVATVDLQNIQDLQQMVSDQNMNFYTLPDQNQQLVSYQLEQ